MTTKNNPILRTIEHCLEVCTQDPRVEPFAEPHPAYVCELHPEDFATFKEVLEVAAVEVVILEGCWVQANAARAKGVVCVRGKDGEISEAL